MAPWIDGPEAFLYAFLLVSSSSYTTLHLLLRCFWLAFTGFLYTLLYLICLRNGFIAPSLVGHTCLAFLAFAFGFCFWLAFWLLPSLPFWLACLTCLTFAVSCLTCVFRLAPCNWLLSLAFYSFARAGFAWKAHIRLMTGVFSYVACSYKKSSCEASEKADVKQIVKKQEHLENAFSILLSPGPVPGVLMFMHSVFLCKLLSRVNLSCGYREYAIPCINHLSSSGKLYSTLIFLSG